MEQWTIKRFADQLSDAAPVPGGGGASALAGALGAALGHMAAALTVDKKRYEAYKEQLSAEMRTLQTNRHRLLFGIQQDADAFMPLREAYTMPAVTEKDKTEKGAAIQRALHAAAQPPLAVLSCCGEVIRSLMALQPIISPLVQSDVGCAAAMCRACAEAAQLNVLINTGAMADKRQAKALADEAQELYRQGISDCERVYEAVRQALCKRN